MASNRGPVSYQFGTDGSLTGQRGGGGMIAGVTEGLAALGPEADVTWICTALSDADRAAAARQDAAAARRAPTPGTASACGCWTSRLTSSTAPTTT